jgi:hypothetical protein
MWERIKALCLNSLTVAWSYCLAFAGAAMQIVDTFADALGDASFKDELSAAIGDNQDGRTNSAWDLDRHHCRAVAVHSKGQLTCGWQSFHSSEARSSRA